MTDGPVLQFIGLHVSVYGYGCVGVWVCVGMSVCGYECVCVCGYVHACVCVRANVALNVYTCTCTCTCIYSTCTPKGRPSFTCTAMSKSTQCGFSPDGEELPVGL